MKPVYWKPRHPTRVMRERAAAKRQLAREAELRRQPHPTLREWLGGLIRRRR